MAPRRKTPASRPASKAARLVKQGERLQPGALPAAPGPGKSPLARAWPHGEYNGFAPANPWRWQPGQSGNPGGRPRLLSAAYNEMLSAEDEQGVTNAAKIAMAQAQRAALFGDTAAAREIRQSTEGDRINFGALTDEELAAEVLALQAQLASLRTGDPAIGPPAPPLLPTPDADPHE